MKLTVGTHVRITDDSFYSGAGFKGAIGVVVKSPLAPALYDVRVKHSTCPDEPLAFSPEEFERV